RDGRLCGTFRKIHLPGTKAPDGFAQVFEPYYFAHGDTGYKVFDAAGARVGIAICQDRRYPESYRALALQGAEVILVGYNTPSSPLALDLNELCLRSGAYANLCSVVGVPAAGGWSPARTSSRRPSPARARRSLRSGPSRCCRRQRA